VKQTHCPTHTSYRLELEDLFRIGREGESRGYASFSGLHNRTACHPGLKDEMSTILIFSFVVLISFCGMGLD